MACMYQTVCDVLTSKDFGRLVQCEQVHPKGEISMTVSGLGCINPSIYRAISPTLSANGPRIKPAHSGFRFPFPFSISTKSTCPGCSEY